MAFVDYKYGLHSEKIRLLLRERLDVKESIRYYEKVLQEKRARVEEIESEVTRLQEQG